MWPDRRLIDLLGIEHPIIQAPMAGSAKADMVAAVSEAGGLGSLGCATMAPDEVKAQLGIIRQRTAKPINVNFFTHTPPANGEAAERRWRERLAPYFAEHGIDPQSVPAGAGRAPFDAAYCALMVELKPKVVSFHFGLPEKALMRRVKDAGSVVLASATTVEEARFLEANGADAIVAQGVEAGGHRGMFLTEDLTSQAGTMALV